MKKIKISKGLVPSLFTALNMVFGFLSIITASKGDYVLASFFIIFAAISDSLDGIMARLTKSPSKFGVELDSLADVISFGVAPSALLYYINFYSLGAWGVILSILPMIFAAMRLARFNVQLVGFDKEYFHGIPAPSAAITICSYIIIFPGEILSNQLFKDLLIPLAIGISLLMVSTIKYDTLPKFTPKDIKRKPVRFIIFTVGLILMIATSGKAIFPFFIFYILTGIIRSAVKLFNQIIRQSKNKKVEILDQ